MDELESKVSDFREKGVAHVKIGFTDIDGVIRGKYVDLEKFYSLLKKGGGFCDCVLGWDIDDQLYEGFDKSFTGWHSGFPDAQYKLIVESERWLDEENCPFFLAEFEADGDHPICPRTRLRKILEELSEAGFSVLSGFEYEFFVFSESSWSVREKGYRDLRPLTPGNFGYSILRNSSESKNFSGLLDFCRALRCELEGLHYETGPGVWEAALKASSGIEAADRGSLFKTFSKVYFQRQEQISTFMAKWSMDYPGQSGHYHFSLLDEEGTNVFFDGTRESCISELQLNALGGLTKYLPVFLPMLAPTINSYTRLVKGAWAPTSSTWGVENRTAAIRVIPGSAASQRIECRAGGADANPYLAGAAILGAALLGIREKLSPGKAMIGNAYEQEDSLPSELKFPTSLGEAADLFESSNQARELFGSDFVDHFVMTRRWEVSEYHRHVNDWQLGRYFEVI